MKYCRLLIHLSLLLIAAGAVATFFTADYGYIHLREGNGPAATWRDGSDGTVLPLPFHIRLDSIEAAKPEIPAWLIFLSCAMPIATDTAHGSMFATIPSGGLSCTPDTRF